MVFKWGYKTTQLPHSNAKIYKPFLQKYIKFKYIKLSTGEISSSAIPLISTDNLLNALGT